MFLISVKCEYENNIKRQLRMYYNENITIFTEDDIDDQKKFKDYRFVITEYNKETIDYFTNQGKYVIVFNDKENSRDSYKNNNLYYCDTEEELINTIKKIGISKKKSIKTEILGLSMAILLITIIAPIILNNNPVDKQSSKTNKVKEQESKRNIKIADKSQNYLFLGDSITDFYKLEDYYPKDLPVVNSGISGNKTYDILNDMENRVYKYNPTKVFLLIGTNDLSERTDPEIVNNIADIVKKIHEHRKNAQVYVESIYPVNNKTEGNDIVLDWMVGTRDNKRIIKLNKMIRENSKEYDYTYLDFHSLLKDEDGLLKLEYTIDGLHISDEGYKLITKEIMKIINNE